jgi:hypothetical protein
VELKWYIGTLEDKERKKLRRTAENMTLFLTILRKKIRFLTYDDDA